MRVVKICLSVYVPDDIIAKGEDSVEEYINCQLYDSPGFIGYIDQGCITITEEHEPDMDEDSAEDVEAVSRWLNSKA